MKRINVICFFVSICLIFAFLNVIACATSYDSNHSSNVEKSVSSSLSTDGGWWQPSPGLEWQIQFNGTMNYGLDAGVVLNELDMFDTDASTISMLHDAGNHVTCYISAGTAENWRPDFNEFPDADLGNSLDPPYNDEFWVDIRDPAVFTIMQNRMLLAQGKACDVMDFDNVDEYTYNGEGGASYSGFPLTYNDQLTYNENLTNYAHSLGMASALKNDQLQYGDLLNLYDMAIVESCENYKECNLSLPFIDAGKPVLEIQYGDQATANKWCPNLNSLNFDAIIKKTNLNAFRIPCR